MEFRENENPDSRENGCGFNNRKHYSGIIVVESSRVIILYHSEKYLKAQWANSSLDRSTKVIYD